MIRGNDSGIGLFTAHVKVQPMGCYVHVSFLIDFRKKMCGVYNEIRTYRVK